MHGFEAITVLDYTDDFVLIYYCFKTGDKQDKQSSSFTVYSMVPGEQLSPELEERFQKAIDQSGAGHLAPPLKDFCQPDYSREKCPPESF
jgi:hypothetical protein